MSDDSMTHLLRIHQTTSEELRHTATIIWQSSIAILTLQGGAVTLSRHGHIYTWGGNGVLVAGFLLSICFSLLMVRQASDRHGYVGRVKAVEVELARHYPDFFFPLPMTLKWFTSVVLAWVLVVESTVGFLIALGRTGALGLLCHCS